MSDEISGRLLDSVREHEGFRTTPYKDTVGVLTVGYGTNLETIDVSRGLATQWLVDELIGLRSKLERHPWFANLSEVRKDAILEMAYQLGYVGVLKFHKMIAALEDGNFWAAASEGMDSRWAREQTPTRAMVIMDRIRSGKWNPPAESRVMDDV